MMENSIEFAVGIHFKKQLKSLSFQSIGGAKFVPSKCGNEVDKFLLDGTISDAIGLRSFLLYDDKIASRTIFLAKIIRNEL